MMNNIAVLIMPSVSAELMRLLYNENYLA